ncbi:tRNA/rRNA methyltransferase, SpoU domain protein [Rhodopirellula maiorica SM1]|uniref:tRNA/rRNA methyltransferase, SpoU domain protein n=1 Tax=Rhodopirellula maiorica SM1 TaxID=1265738 RepID=M5RPB9_9BACT|nr:RNA methyltransferase [Rhodopirellula maiorica]EMI21145.1 tRNA/rRNA methyltransferase, SpoU domain protein [Rhodopirellula maiorica SM1]
MNQSRVIQATGIDDPRIAVYRDLRHRELSKDGSHFVVEGNWVVRRLIESDYKIESILVQQHRSEEYAEIVPADVPIYTLSDDAISQLIGFEFHRGVLACGVRSVIPTLDDFITLPKIPKLSIALLGVSEPENVGSIFRSAAALGVDHIFVDRKTIDPFHRRVIRVSMAAVFKHHLFRLDDPLADLQRLTAATAIRTIASTLQPPATRLRDFRVDDTPILLMIGNEASGVELPIQQFASDRVTIPMQLGTDSLNVAVATAILMHAFADPDSE